MTFPTDKLNKACVLAPMATVAPTDFTPGPGATRGTFAKPNFAIAKNLEAWGHLKRQTASGFFADTGTKVVRLWADWNAIQLFGPDRFNSPSLEALDSNIAAAKAAGLKVILTSRGFPGWVTGYAAELTPGEFRTVPDNGRIESAQGQAYLDEFGELPEPRRVAAERAFRAARADQGHPAGTDEPGFGAAILQLRFPGSISDADPTGAGSRNPDLARTDLLGPGQPWHRWISFLANRYHPSRQADTIAQAPPRIAGASIDVLEIVNEPNFECWPQVAQSQPRYQIAARMTAEMIRQGAAIEVAVNSGAKEPLFFAAPATSDLWRARDRAPNERFRSSYDRFLVRVAKLLGAGFDAGQRFMFTHHNYTDIENPRRARPLPRRYATRSVNSSAWVLSLMRGSQVRVRPSPGAPLVSFRWTGWPSATAPCLLLTEGGARLQDSPRITRANQPARVRRMFEETRDGRYGEGIVLFSNFLVWRDIDRNGTRSWLVDRRLDRGDVEMLAPGAEPSLAEYGELQRPVYDAWKALEE